MSLTYKKRNNLNKIKTMRIKTPEELAQPESGKKAVTVYLDAILVEDVKSKARKAGISMSKLVNEAISAYLQELKKR